MTLIRWTEKVMKDILWMGEFRYGLYLRYKIAHTFFGLFDNGVIM